MLPQSCHTQQCMSPPHCSRSGGAKDMLSTSRVVQLKSVSAGPGDIEFILIPWSLYISCSMQDIASRDVVGVV